MYSLISPSMNEPIIKVTQVSKKYQLGSRQSYLTIRDKIMEFSHRFLRTMPSGTANKRTDFWALKNINFEIKKGEVVGLIGRNGAGKSTLLKILSRITYPTTGQVSIRGTVSSLLEVGTGFSPELTGRENIFLNGSILGMTRAEINKRFDQIVEFAELDKFIDTPVKHYSSGMYTRLAFSVAAHLEPDILLVDEVLAVGDSEFQKKCLGKMSEVTQKDGRTIIFVSHNLTAVRSLCSRCILLKNGTIEKIGDTEEVINKYIKESSRLMSQPIIDRADRQGSGSVKVYKVELFQNNQSANELISGFDTTIRVHYRIIERSKKSISVAIAINDASAQIRLMMLSSSVLGKNITLPTNKKVGYVDFVIKKLPLTTGAYNFNTWIECKGEMVDWVIDAGEFRVLFGDFYGTGKLPLQSQGAILPDYEVFT